MAYKTMVDDKPKWITLDCTLSDNKLFKLEMRHIGFFHKRGIIVVYNKFINKCDYELRLKDNTVIINDIDNPINIMITKNNIKYLVNNKNNGLPFIFEIVDNRRINFKIIMDILNAKKRKLIATINLEITFFPDKESFEIISCNVNYVD